MLVWQVWLVMAHVQRAGSNPDKRVGRYLVCDAQKAQKAQKAKPFWVSFTQIKNMAPTDLKRWTRCRWSYSAKIIKDILYIYQPRYADCVMSAPPPPLRKKYKCRR
jgi:hypothetical protein